MSMIDKERIKPVEILLVEDSPGDIGLTKEGLKESKLYNRLHVVTDGEEAISFLHEKGKYADVPYPDLILLDLNLPKKDGREVLAEIKTDERLRKIPVVIMTISKAEEDVCKAYGLHANCYIVKPIDLNQFVSVVKTIENFWFTIVKLPSIENDAG